MTPNLDPDRIAQARSILQQRETEDLLALWRENDQVEWTPEAFEAMRLILRERLGDESTWPTETDEEDGYVCSTCGAPVALTDKFCRECGANVEEIVENNSEGTPTPLQTELSLNSFEFAFWADAARLPEAYTDYFVTTTSEVLIPAHNPEVGGLKVRVLPTLVQVAVGDHTEAVFNQVTEAVDFINDVLTDQIAFLIDEEGVEVCQVNELDDEEKMDGATQVWSGSLRDSQLGIDEPETD